VSALLVAGEGKRSSAYTASVWAVTSRSCLRTSEYGQPRSHSCPLLTAKPEVSRRNKVKTSVADTDPGSGAFLTPGSGMGKKNGSGSGINNPDQISESAETIF
jgi:hypothetical protein